MLDPHRNALAIMQLKYGGEMVDHVGFGVTDYSRCKAFYERALAPLGITLLMESVAEAGGTDNGAPGVRETHHPNYHAAYVLDPDGNNVEAVCHTPACPPDQASVFSSQWSANGSSLNGGTSTQPAER